MWGPRRVAGALPSGHPRGPSLGTRWHVAAPCVARKLQRLVCKGVGVRLKFQSEAGSVCLKSQLYFSADGVIGTSPTQPGALASPLELSNAPYRPAVQFASRPSAKPHVFKEHLSPTI